MRPGPSVTPCTQLLSFVSGWGICRHAKLGRGKVNTSNGIAGFVGEMSKASHEMGMLDAVSPQYQNRHVDERKDAEQERRGRCPEGLDIRRA